MDGQLGGLAVGLEGGVGYGGVLGGAGALGAPSGQSVELAVGLGRGSDTAELWAGPEPSARHRSRSAEQATTGRMHRGSAGRSLATAALATPRPRWANRSWSSPATRLWQVVCGGRPASMQRAAVQGYVGDTVDISARVHTMLEILDGIDFLAFVPRGGAGVHLPLSQHLCVLGHAFITAATRGFPQDAADLHVAHARVEALRVAFEFGAEMLNSLVIEHYAIANSWGNRARLAESVRKDMLKFTMNLRAVSDICGHSCVYPPAVSAFPAIAEPHWPRLDAYMKSGGLINADVLQSAVAVAPGPAIAAGIADGECRQWSRNGRWRFGDTYIFKHVGPAQAGENGAKRAAGGRPMAVLPLRMPRPRRPKARKRRQREAVVPGSSGGSSGSGGGSSGSDGGGSGSGASGVGVSIRSTAAKAKNRGAGHVPWGRGLSEGVRKWQRKMHSF